MAKRDKHRNEGTGITDVEYTGRKNDLLTLTTAQTVTDWASADIHRQQTVAQCELDATETLVTELEARIAEAKMKRRRILAKLAGYTLALGRRKIAAE